MFKGVIDTEHIEAGGPECGHRSFFITAGQQHGTARGGHIRMARNQRAQLLDLPLELRQGRRRKWINQANAHCIATAHRLAIHGHQHGGQIKAIALADALDGIVQITIVDATSAIEATAHFLGQPGAPPRKTAGGGQRLGKRQMLEPVQSIVVHEVADRSLARQHMLEVVDARLEARTNIHGPGHMRAHLKPRTCAPGALPNCRSA